MIVLDTNVVFELMRQEPNVAVVDWVDQLPLETAFITAVTAAELRYGVARLPDGTRKKVLTTKVDELIADDFDDQVLPFDTDAASYYADIAAFRERQGHPISMADAQIAAISRLYDARLATRNVKAFDDTGIPVTNPWDVPPDRP
ncbi:type II toxin-antitoxin system VapC family toxin [Haloechinothrix salitolerans]|uniref:Ribonuclease VapC n=1 Tax=Haloechinothrix salitolerans TaxID=926830 RepID=A0ABW2C6C1_9PSEU